VDRRAGRVLEPDLALAHGFDEARRRAEFAERHCGGLEGVDAACADQHIGLHAAHRHADDVQMPGVPADERACRRHGDTRIIRRSPARGEIKPRMARRKVVP